MRYLGAFFGKVIHSAVHKHFGKLFLLNCVRRSGLCCSGIHGLMSLLWLMIVLKFMDPVTIEQGSIS
jgi:hypothetical protein